MTERFERDVIDRLARIEETVSNIKSLQDRVTILEDYINVEKGKNQMRYTVYAMLGALLGGGGVAVITFVIDTFIH